MDAALAALGLVDRVRELPSSTRTAAEAADAVGCEVRQIVKSLVFRKEGSGEPVLLLVSGAHRVDLEWAGRWLGAEIRQADAEYVRSVAGYAIGGVPPIGHAGELPTYIDYDLLELREVWAAAGTPNAICRLTSTELLEATKGRPMPMDTLRPAMDPSDRWITFDCYGTLVDWRSGLLAAVDRAAGSVPASLRLELFSAYLTEEQRIEDGAYRTYREVMAEALVAAARHVGVTISEGGIVDSIPDWPLFADTLPALSDLVQSGARLGILSNIDHDLIERTIARHGLPIDLVVTAEEVRSYKPALAHWIRFLRHTGARPEATWHVAGGYHYDMPPAAHLGFRTAYVARYPGPAPGPEAHVTVSSLQEFVDGLSKAAE